MAVIRYLTAPLRAQHAKIYVIDQVNALPVSFLLDEVKNRGPSMVGLDESLYENFAVLGFARVKPQQCCDRADSPGKMWNVAIAGRDSTACLY